MALAKLERFTEALCDLDKMLKLEPKTMNSQVYKVRAQCFIHSEDMHDALPEIKKAIALNPSADNYKLQGELLVSLNRPQEAVSSYDKALRLEPKGFWIYKERGDTHCLLKNYQKAVDDYSAMIRLMPKEPIGYNNRAKIYELMGKKDLAKKDREEHGRDKFDDFLH